MRFARTASCVALFGVVAAVDSVITAGVDLPVPVLGPVDWLGHLATTGIAVLALGPRNLARHARTVGVVAVSSVAIDIDHVPYYLHLIDQGRPATHSLLTPAVLLLAGVGSRRHRRALFAVAAGVALHLLRDVATGPGVALLGPLVNYTRVPWAWYALVLAGLVAAVAVRDVKASGVPRTPVAERPLLVAGTD